MTILRDGRAAVVKNEGELEEQSGINAFLDRVDQSVSKNLHFMLEGNHPPHENLVFLSLMLRQSGLLLKLQECFSETIF